LIVYASVKCIVKIGLEWLVVVKRLRGSNTGHIYDTKGIKASVLGKTVV